MSRKIDSQSYICNEIYNQFFEMLRNSFNPPPKPNILESLMSRWLCRLTDEKQIPLEDRIYICRHLLTDLSNGKLSGVFANPDNIHKSFRRLIQEESGQYDSTQSEEFSDTASLTSESTINCQGCEELEKKIQCQQQELGRIKEAFEMQGKALSTKFKNSEQFKQSTEIHREYLNSDLINTVLNVFQMMGWQGNELTRKSIIAEIPVENHLRKELIGHSRIFSGFLRKLISELVTRERSLAVEKRAELLRDHELETEALKKEIIVLKGQITLLQEARATKDLDEISFLPQTKQIQTEIEGDQIRIQLQRAKKIISKLKRENKELKNYAAVQQNKLDLKATTSKINEALEKGELTLKFEEKTEMLYKDLEKAFQQQISETIGDHFRSKHN